MARHAVFRDGRLHVMSKMCDTCIFRPGNLMNLHEGRFDQLVAEALEAQSCIPCHKKLNDPEDAAVCAGFIAHHGEDVVPIALAAAMDLVEREEPPRWK